MELSYDEIENILIKIFTGQNIVTVNDGSRDVLIKLKHPSNIDKLTSYHIYSTSYDEAIKGGLLSTEKLTEVMSERGIFTDKDQARIDDLLSKRTAQEAVLKKTTIQANRERIEKLINNIDKEINKLYYKKSSTLMLSANAKAEDDKLSYLCWSGIYDISDKRVWESYDKFLKETNLTFKNKVTLEFMRFNNGIDFKTIRYIARHNLWRIRYVSSMKLSESLFGVPTSDYNKDMLHLVYWSNYYQNIYDMMPEHRPSDDVIEDDDALDSYMNDYYSERSKDDLARKDKNKHGKLSSMNKEEVVITQFNELYQKIKYDKPREAEKIKDKAFIKKKARRRR